MGKHAPCIHTFADVPSRNILAIDSQKWNISMGSNLTNEGGGTCKNWETKMHARELLDETSLRHTHFL